MPRPSRAFVAVLTIVVLGLVGPTLVAAPAGAEAKAAAKKTAPSAATAAAQSLLELINDERAAAGLDALAGEGALTDVAVSWSQTMAASKRLAHHPALRDQVEAAVPDWRGLGENVGVGADVESLHQAFMASAGHRRNILGDFDRVGVGVVAAKGRLWVTVDFVRSS